MLEGYGGWYAVGHNIVGNKGLLRGFIRQYKDFSTIGLWIVVGLFEGFKGNDQAHYRLNKYYKHPSTLNFDYSLSVLV